jgi:hypothetical protein
MTSNPHLEACPRGYLMTIPSIAEGLSEAEKAALLQFANDDELLLAQNGEEVALVLVMMNAGLVSYIHAAGHIFMQLRPLGLAVRQYLLDQLAESSSS